MTGNASKSKSLFCTKGIFKIHLVLYHCILITILLAILYPYCFVVLLSEFIQKVFLFFSAFSYWFLIFQSFPLFAVYYQILFYHIIHLYIFFVLSYIFLFPLLLWTLFPTICSSSDMLIVPGFLHFILPLVYLCCYAQLSLAGLGFPL